MKKCSNVSRFTTPKTWTYQAHSVVCVQELHQERSQLSQSQTQVCSATPAQRSTAKDCRMILTHKRFINCCDCGKLDNRKMCKSNQQLSIFTGCTNDALVHCH